MKFKPFDVPAYPVDIREWNCFEDDPNGGEPIRYEQCYVRPLNVMEWSEFTKLASTRESDDSDLSLARIAVRFALKDDKEGKPMFTSADLEDIARNDNRPAVRIRNKLLEINTIPRDEMERLEKN